MSEIKQRLDKDVKSTMLAGDKLRLECLRGLKSAILYAEVAKGKREGGLNDQEILELFAKEAKKRQDSADLYVQGGSTERADKELAEKAIIEEYLPEQLSEKEIGKVVDEIIKNLGATGPEMMGQVIGATKAKLGSLADGAVIAKIVKGKL